MKMVNKEAKSAGLIFDSDQSEECIKGKKKVWTAHEDQNLQKLVNKHGAKNWKAISEFFTDRTDVQCLHRWQKVLNPDLIKGP